MSNPSRSHALPGRTIMRAFANPQMRRAPLQSSIVGRSHPHFLGSRSSPGMADAPDDDPTDDPKPTDFTTPKGGLFGGAFDSSGVDDPNVLAQLMDYRWVTELGGDTPARRTQVAAPRTLRKVRRQDRAPLGRHCSVLPSRQQGLAWLRRRPQQQDPRRSATRIRTARRRIPAPQGPHLYAATVLKSAQSTHTNPR